MSGLFSTLNSSSMALNAHSRAIETSGKNLANVNNPNYSRQRVIYGDRGTVETAEGPESLGLEVLGVRQLRDVLLDRQLMREIGLSGSLDSLRDSLQRAQAGLGQSIDGSADVSAAGSASGGLSAALDNFFNAFQNLAARPTDVGARQTLLQKAAILTDTMRETDTRLAQVQSDIDVQVSAGVDSANTLLGTIADLNSQITRLEIAHPGAAIDLRDQRQARLEELAAILPINVTDTGGGNIRVAVKDASNADIVLVNGATVAGPVTFTGTGLTGGTPATAVVLNGGSIQGALQARDGAVQTLRDNLDLFAEQLVTSVNGAYNPSATAGADFFDPAGLTAGTIAIRSGLTAATLVTGTSGAAGDNTIALAVAGLASQAFSVSSGDLFDGTFSQFYTRSVSDLGQALSTTTARASDQENIQRLVRNQRDTVSGVSLDEEMADLVRYQRAFQASSRVFSVVDELLDTVVNRLGV
ncbi:MAG TPA: flagellar hook-associated protein FlgK [Lacunisphaera sp.]|nr:flagellar hook-associated protein FlgK [Lacunisphaera sp.]